MEIDTKHFMITQKLGHFVELIHFVFGKMLPDHTGEAIHLDIETLEICVISDELNGIIGKITDA